MLSGCQFGVGRLGWGIDTQTLENTEFEAFKYPAVTTGLGQYAESVPEIAADDGAGKTTRHHRSRP